MGRDKEGGTAQPRLEVAIALIGSILAGLLALLIIAKDTLQAEGRVTYVGLSAFAIMLILGVSQLTGRTRVTRVFGLVLWPATLLGVNVYVLAHFVWPLRGL